MTAALSPLRRQVNRLIGQTSSFVLSLLAAFLVTMNVVVESFHSARLGATLAVLLVLHLVRFPRLIIGREVALYAAFVVYMLLSLLWTEDLRLAANTLVPSLAFIVVLLLFQALATYHDHLAVLTGTLAGIVMGAAMYTVIEGFPMVRPPEFSYNAVAGIYLAGLFLALLCACYTRHKALFAVIAITFQLLTLATTSIKYNLGILLGLLAAFLLHSGRFSRALRKNALPLSMLAVVLAGVLLSNDALKRTLQVGMDRVALGIEVLQARDNVSGYSSFESRATWLSEGVGEWLRNPLFGYGVEAFRDRYGMTSHSTPVDLLFNSGLIGLTLFYGIFAAMFSRVLHVRAIARDGRLIVITGGWACYLFVSLSAPMHYNAFLALFIAISTSILRECSGRPHGVESRMPQGAATHDGV